MTMYTAIVYKFRKCPDCDSQDAGLYNRVDCGCVWQEEVGQYPTANAARLAAMAKARKRGTWNGGRSTGEWNVENDDGIVEVGSVKVGKDCQPDT